jgi:wyosine [tRNA(Phe)-imidazoG37] synthetase (radical SAM superfamily)
MTVPFEPRLGRHVFGPVPSRRLGKSLGVDLIPPKTCSLDCVYCQLSRTTQHTTERASFVDWRAVVEEVRGVLASGQEVDAITISGSGEPTLNQDMGRVLEALGKITDATRVVITNGTLLWRDDVRAELVHADLVMPSLDAVTPQAFAAVNRPAAGLSLEQHLSGLRRFAAETKARIWLEILLVEGLNDSDADLDALVAFLDGFSAERIQLNTVVRTPVDRSLARPISLATTERFRQALSEIHPHVEVIGTFQAPATSTRDVSEADVLTALARRPCQREELAASTGADPTALGLVLDALLKRASVLVDGDGYYRVGP